MQCKLSELLFLHLLTGSGNTCPAWLLCSVLRVSEEMRKHFKRETVPRSVVIRDTVFRGTPNSFACKDFKVTFKAASWVLSSR